MPDAKCLELRYVLRSQVVEQDSLADILGWRTATRFINGYAEGQNKHNWAEVYLPGSGWVQMDPTWGRDPVARDQYFASTTFDHFLITRGRNLNTLDNYYYLMFRWWQDEGETRVDFAEEWDILPAE